jgi:hypothetical protein
MIDLVRGQLKRECADAPEALHGSQSLDGLAMVVELLRALGPTYRPPWRAWRTSRGSWK